MEFEKRKALTLSSMVSPEPDKSPKGDIDTPIIPLLNSINKHPSYFTTSSCSGRISILVQSQKPASKKKSGGGGWLFITHEPADPDAVVNILFNNETLVGSSVGELVFRFEPLIVAVECKDVASAQLLVSTAITSGLRESGITSANKRIMVAIRCSIRMEVPLGEISQVMVSPEYVRYLVMTANEKMKSNEKRTERFLQAFQALKCQEHLGLTGEVIDNHNMQQSCLLNKESSSHLKTQLVSISSTIDVLENKLPNPGMQDSSYLDDNCINEEINCDAQWKQSHIEIAEPADPCNVTSDSIQLLYDNHQGEGSDEDVRSEISVPVTNMVIHGEAVEKLFLWGHSTCIVNDASNKKIMIFGGFGGSGRHARRNDSLLLDPHSCMLEVVNVKDQPSPRVGHTSSIVGDHMYIIGGRGDPTQIMNDVWVLNTTKYCWKILDCRGSVFSPRHRHAAAVIGSKIYIFGGVNNEAISSQMHVLETRTNEWSEISMHGTWPCARHSHSMVANEFQLFLFGGYDGEKVLGDLYTFDIKKCKWKEEKITGRTPSPRFSHSMFIYKHFIGIIGGCPLNLHHQYLSILDLHHRVWKNVTVCSLNESLIVRSTADVVNNDLVIVGGGASCFAFGTKFNEPVQINLLPLFPEKSVSFDGNTSIQTSEIKNGSYTPFQSLKNCVLHLQRNYAKLGKDILKKFRWLDQDSKVYNVRDGKSICFLVTEQFRTLFLEKKRCSTETELECIELFHLEGKKISLNEISSETALHFLTLYGSLQQHCDIVSFRKAPKSPQKVLREAVQLLLKHKNMPMQLLEHLPTRWERLGNILVLPVLSFNDSRWESISEELWPIVAKSLGASRLARQGRVMPTGTRDSALEMLVGDDGWVDHHENGILYSFDATKCMFSFGNLSEKLRMAGLDCKNEVIVDLFAGIGYFVLPFLVRAKAKLVYACEWNPHALHALRHNLQANFVEDRCIILKGDNKHVAPKGVADRVCLGLLPSSENSWLTAVRALRDEGGILHIHGNVKDTEESSWLEHVAKSIENIAKSEGLLWDVSIQHLERVKWYGPRIRHLVADVKCKQLHSASWK